MTPQHEKRLLEFVVSHGECHSENCGDDPSLPRAKRLAYVKAHEHICTCGASRIYRLAVDRLKVQRRTKRK